MMRKFGTRAIKKREMTPKLEKTNKPILGLIKGALVGLAISLVGVLLFALLIKIAPIPDGVIKPVNQVIKGLSILFGCIVGLKKIDRLGFVNGLIIGLFYFFLSFLVFSILDGHFEFSITFLTDMLFSALMGAISGIIAINFRKKSKN